MLWSRPRQLALHAPSTHACHARMYTCTRHFLRCLLLLLLLLLLRQVEMDPSAFELDAADVADLKSSRLRRRVHEVLSRVFEEKREGKKLLRIHFLRAPTAVLSTGGGTVAGLEVERTELAAAGEGGGGGARRAVGTGQREVIPAQLVSGRGRGLAPTTGEWKGQGLGTDDG
jgi:hypothetical protein